MKNKIEFSYFRKSKISLFGLLLFSLFLIPFISSTAQFETIELQSIGFNSYHEIDLRDYCTSNSGSFCRDSSFGIQFTNPDNGAQISLFTSGEHSNSYFIITLINGLIQIQANSKEVSLTITVYGADVEFSSQSSTSFTLQIISNPSPEQIASFLPPVLNGNDSIFYNMNGFFLNYDRIRVSYNDDILRRTVSFSQNKTNQTFSCTSGQIRVCLQGVTNSIILQIQGMNISYNSSVTGGNNFVITAINPYGETVTSFPVIVYATFGNITEPTFDHNPIRKPLSIAPITINLDENVSFEFQQKVFDFNFFYKDMTYYIINFSFMSDINNNYTIWHTSYFNGTYVVCRILNGAGPLCSTYPSTDNFQGTTQSGVISPGPNFFSSYGNRQSQTFLIGPSSTTTEITLQINLSACNNNGCTTEDGFGNRDRLFLLTRTVIPEAAPLTFAPITLGFGETKTFNFNDMFFDFSYLVLNWSESSQNFSVRTPSISDIYNTSTYAPSGTPIYQTRLFYTNYFSITSGNQNHNFTVYPIACGGNVCIDGTQGIPQSITFIIQDTSLGFAENQISSGLFRNLFNTFLGLFPDGDSLSSRAKANYFLITVALFFGLILFFGYKSGSSGASLVIFGLVVSFFVMVFLTFKGYLSPLIIGIPILISIIVLAIKFRGNG